MPADPRATAILLGVLLFTGAEPGRAQDAGPETEAVDSALAVDREARELRRESEEAAAAASQAEAQVRQMAAEIQVLEGRALAAERRLQTLQSRRGALLDRVAEREEGLTALLAALQSMARRPAAAMLLEPGSALEAARLASLVKTVRPKILARTADLRADLDRLAALRRSVAKQRSALARTEAQLSERMSEYSDAAARYRRRSRSLSQNAATAATRASRLAANAVEAAGLDRGLALPDDIERGRRLRSHRPARAEVDALGYRRPATGPVLARFGAPSEVGVIGRGITLGTRKGALVTSPANGTVVYAGPFRDYGGVVILEHGNVATGPPMTTIISGLADVEAQVGQEVSRGLPVGRAGAAGVALELRRGGTPVDPLFYIAGEARASQEDG
ncbi:hypothetical protein B5C34_01370 [Pacificimonas flava]|uniref:M23ase beta-sheet core domain-containing protein n=2 Tax=Pacificimonas TaxID=1960290 RepID=A0A219B1M0_9SPHN|nr:MULTISPECIES: peptidoglycan DD-metalloendopeptidase family protein [Pacificimonas]MBZ6378134.1 peptidoglycan DD-metalloendopeptidase family protein [Pacificimonas aurantium]OWV32231.1 hypothetical protein B5C34_01370 [Pacificimonas flava]